MFKIATTQLVDTVKHYAHKPLSHPSPLSLALTGENKKFNIKKAKKKKKKKKENNLEIIHYNCQGLTSEDRIVELEHALNKVKIWNHWPG